MNHSEFQSNLTIAVNRHQSGDLVGAKIIYRKLLKQQPKNSELHHLLGLLYQQLGKLNKSIKHHKLSLNYNPEEPRYLNTLATVYIQTDNSEKLVGLCDKYDKSQYRNIEIFIKQADFYTKTKKTNLAKQKYEELTGFFPEDWRVWLGKGNAYFVETDLVKAKECYLKVIELNENEINSLNNLGAIYSKNKEYEKAIEYFEQCLKIDIGFMQAWVNLASAFVAINDYAQAESACLKCLEKEPNHLDCNIILIELYTKNGNPEKAKVLLSKLQKENVCSTRLLNAAGNLYLKENNYAEAKRQYLLATKIDKEHSDTFYNLGVVCLLMKDFFLASQFFKQTLELDADYYNAIPPYIHSLRQSCLWGEVNKQITKLRHVLKTNKSISLPAFSIITLEDSTNSEQKWIAKYLFHQYQNKYEMLLNDKKQTPKKIASAAKKSRIKLAYLSADFHQHATALLIARVFELHNTNEFEIYAFSYGVNDNSKMRKRIFDSFEHFVDLEGMSPYEISNEIKSRQIEILIDLKGFTQNSLSELLIFRPAPILINYLGYPATMGSELVDYTITDRYLSSEDLEQFDEKLLYLPNCYQPNDNTRYIPPCPTRKQLGLPDEAIILGMFNQAYKITDEMVSAWCSILSNTTNSVLWCLIREDVAKENIVAVFAKQGVDSDRIIFAENCAPDEHLGRIQQADLMLDTFPVNGHTTTSDALWAGVPVITISGQTFISRVAGSLLKNMGLEELICSNISQYIKLAIKFIQNEKIQETLNKKIISNRTNSPLFDSEQYTRDLEFLYKKVYSERYG